MSLVNEPMNKLNESIGRAIVAEGLPRAKSRESLPGRVDWGYSRRECHTNQAGGVVNNRRVLVTGGAGFIGSHLVDLLLADGASRVVVVDNFFLGTRENLADAQAADGALCIIHENAEDLPAMREIIEREEIQDVFNLATKALEYSFDNPAGAARVNTDIALTLGELLRKGHYERLFHTSSSEVFGTARERPMTEDHPRNPTTPYAAGKAGADLILQSYARTFDLDIRIVRPFNNYGPRQNTGRYAGIVPLTMERLLAGKAPILHGDGSQGRDFVFVRDVARGLLTVAACPDARGQEFNLASGIETSVLELLETLCRVAGFDGEWIREDRRTADVDHHIGDGNRLAEVTGFRPPTSLEEGLESTWKWYASAAGGSP
ncbi:MAG: GDP-mannose 4,6-dehydratase [Gemmatimonadota bacterium]|jgi:UDP-glucose 4-epimerase|nr:GDP-mannose 4,6-dehydratase [Gemmatimonadota bacterium]